MHIFLNSKDSDIFWVMWSVCVSLKSKLEEIAKFVIFLVPCSVISLNSILISFMHSETWGIRMNFAALLVI